MQVNINHDKGCLCGLNFSSFELPYRPTCFSKVDCHLGDKPTGRQPAGREKLPNWATHFRQLGGRVIKDVNI